MRITWGVVGVGLLGLTLVAGCDSASTGALAPSSPASTASATRSAPSTPAAPRSVTITATGELLAHVPVNRSAQAYAGGSGYDYTPMFAEVADRLKSGDITICHLETPLSPDDTNLSKPRQLIFNTPHTLAIAAKEAGYDGCDFASNHTWDRGLAGLKNTVQVLQDSGLVYAGPRGDADSTNRPGIYQANGLTVAQLGYHYTTFNNAAPNTQVPQEAPWLAQTMWPIVGAQGMIQDAMAAKAAGADLVVVSVHWGTEYQTSPTNDQVEITQALLTSGAVDLVLGTHAHVVQPCVEINGRIGFYGLGNFLSNQSPVTASSLPHQTQEGVIVDVTLTVAPDGTVSSTADYQPTRVELAGHVVKLATQSYHPEVVASVAKSLDAGGSCPATLHPSGP